MALPTNRTEFKEYCKRALGAPVLKVHVAEEQMDDRIDDALKMYWDYHFDGSQKIYYKHQVTAQDKTNKYITLPSNINGAVRIFRPSGMVTGGGIFDIRYQIALNDMYTLTSQSMIPFFQTMQHLELMEQLLVGEKPIRYNRHTDKLHIDMDWDRIPVDSFLIVEAYEVIDPDVYEQAWSDRWLLRYATALIKRQNGENLKKFNGMQMPGGITFNGQQIWNEAQAEIEALEADLLNSNSAPLGFYMG